MFKVSVQEARLTLDIPLGNASVSLAVTSALRVDLPLCRRCCE